jgi:hypothetical protein
MGLHDGHDRISRDLLRFLVLIIYPFSAIFACFYETQGRPCAADLVIYTSYFSQDKKKITRTLVMRIHNAATSRMVLLERTWQQPVQCPSVQERGDDVCFLGCAGQVHCNGIALIAVHSTVAVRCRLVPTPPGAQCTRLVGRQLVVPAEL